MPYRTTVTAPSHLDEAAFRALLGADGVLRPGALSAPPRDRAYAVFAQRDDARLDVDALQRQAERFFQTKLGLTVDKRYGPAPLAQDAMRVVLYGDDPSAAGTRLCYGRLALADDLAAAEQVEQAQGTYGLAVLAQRCRALWLVIPETEEDRVALTLAAIFASSMLGPILSPASAGPRELFGVRTARMKLERLSGPYR
jgi:hypothetical protein